jgi:hypothetical protein
VAIVSTICVSAFLASSLIFLQTVALPARTVVSPTRRP